MYPPLEPGYYYHIYNRGNNGENIFVEDKNYAFFLTKYREYGYPVFDTFCYCLLKNHFHLFIRVRNKQEVKQLLKGEDFEEKTIQRLADKEWTPGLISQQTGHCFNSYTQAFNKKYNRTGSLFERPFERRRVDDPSYFCNLICYIHRNPQKHHLAGDYTKYPYSSFAAYVSGKQTRLNTTEPIKWFGGKKTFLTIHQKKAMLDKFCIEK